MEKVIEAVDMTKKFGSFVANDSLTFNVGRGEIFGLLGANGAGKTTAIRIMCGLLRPTSGKITVAGMNVYRQAERIKRRIGYMSQSFSLYEDLTILENIRFYGGIYGLPERVIRRKSQELAEKLDFWRIRNSLIGSLPPGWKQKLSFSIAVMHRPDIVFLDEPTSGVDPDTRRQFWDLIYETAAEGITVFVTTHYMDEAEYCERVCIMADGRIEATGSPADLKELYGAGSIDDVFVKIARPPRG